MILGIGLIWIAAASVSPLAMAQRGLIQCYQPDDRQKTCRSVASYESIDGRNYRNRAVLLISPIGPLTLETTTFVTVEGNAVCGMITVKEIADGKLRRADRLVDQDQAASALQAVARLMSALTNKKICTRYEASPIGSIAKVSVNGEYQPELDQFVKWVDPHEGYRVGPQTSK